MTAPDDDNLGSAGGVGMTLAEACARYPEAAATVLRRWAQEHVATEADKIEHACDYTPETAGERVRETERQARTCAEPEERRRLRLRCAAWALVALRAEAREQAAAKEGGT